MRNYSMLKNVDVLNIAGDIPPLSCVFKYIRFVLELCIESRKVR